MTNRRRRPGTAHRPIYISNTRTRTVHRYTRHYAVLLSTKINDRQHFGSSVRGTIAHAAVSSSDRCRVVVVRTRAYDIYSRVGLDDGPCVVFSARWPRTSFRGHSGACADNVYTYVALPSRANGVSSFCRTDVVTLSLQRWKKKLFRTPWLTRRNVFCFVFFSFSFHA